MLAVVGGSLCSQVQDEVICKVRYVISISSSVNLRVPALHWSFREAIVLDVVENVDEGVRRRQTMVLGLQK